MNIVSYLLWAPVLLLLPSGAGYAVCRLLSLRPNPAKSYLVGCFTQWAFFQVVTIPMTLLKLRFTWLVAAACVFMGVLCVLGVRWWLRDRKTRAPRRREHRDYADWFALGLLVLGYAAMTAAMIFLQYENQDDWQFVVLSVDIVRTDSLFTVYFGTGNPVTDLTAIADQNFVRFILSPWAAYVAWAAKITGTHPTIMAHTVLPHALTLGMLCAYWLLADHYFKKSLFARCSFVFLAFLVNVYSGYTTYTAESFSVLRIWQGKAVVAGLGIPALYLFLAWIYDEPDRWSRYLLLYMGCLAVCLMSSMGIILGGILTGGCGLAYGILKKKVSVALKIWLGTLVCLSFYGLYLLLV